MSKLPKGWVEAELGDVCNLLNGRAYKKAELLEAGKYPVLRVGNFFTSQKWYHSDLELESNKYCDNGDLLYAWSASFGPQLWSGGKVIYHYHIWRVDLIETIVEKKFLYGWFHWDKENIKAAHGTGSTMIHVTKHDMEKRSINLPPLAEQKRIVAKLDALSARSARARKDLECIDALVARYKQAVLSKAFDPSHSHPSIFFREYIRAANNGLSKRTGEEGPEVNVLRLADLVDGEFSPTAPRKIRLTDKELKKYRLHAGDLVVIRVNGSSSLVGRAFAYKESDVWAFCDHFIRIQLNEHCDPEFAGIFLNSPHVRSIIEHNFVSTSGQKTISQKTLEELPAPNLPLSEQREIVRRIESAFDKIDRLAGEAKRALALVGRLDEAVLAKAFRGELVPQDPNDEPASVLLERIRAERAAAPKQKRGRKAVQTDVQAGAKQ